MGLLLWLRSSQRYAPKTYDIKGMLVAELGGPTMFARIGIMRALNHGKPDPAIVPQGSAPKFTRSFASR